jgi:glutamine synthetase
MDRRLALPDPVDVDPAFLSADDQSRRGITPLPASLAVALEAFTADDTLPSALGPGLVEAIAAVRESEIELFAGHTPEEITAATRWAH